MKKRNYKIISLFVILLIAIGITFCISHTKKEGTVLGDPKIEMGSVEKYVRDNITLIAPEKAVLGGTWYVTSIEIDPDTNTGHVSYEDGHIAAKARFSYIYNEKENMVTVGTLKEDK